MSVKSSLWIKMGGRSLREDNVIKSNKTLKISELFEEDVQHYSNLENEEQVEFLGGWFDLLVSSWNYDEVSLSNKLIHKGLFVHSLNEQVKVIKTEGNNEQVGYIVETSAGRFRLSEDGRLLEIPKDSIFDFPIHSKGSYGQQIKEVQKQLKDKFDHIFNTLSAPNQYSILYAINLLNVADKLYAELGYQEAIDNALFVAKVMVNYAGGGATMKFLLNLPQCTQDFANNMLFKENVDHIDLIKTGLSCSKFYWSGPLNKFLTPKYLQLDYLITAKDSLIGSYLHAQFGSFSLDQFTKILGSSNQLILNIKNKKLAQQTAIQIESQLMALQFVQNVSIGSSINSGSKTYLASGTIVKQLKMRQPKLFYEYTVNDITFLSEYSLKNISEELLKKSLYLPSYKVSTLKEKIVQYNIGDIIYLVTNDPGFVLLKDVK